MDVTKLKKVDKKLSIKERIDFLRHCASLYESNGSSPISDKEYDEEYYELEKISPDDPFFDEVGGSIDEHIYGTPVKHDVKMGSLSKCLDIDSFDKWIRLNFQNIYSFLFEHKIDGLSLGLIYDNGKLIRAVTRGDGDTGIDVTKNALYVKNVKHTIPYKGKVEIRGECYKDKNDFYKNWHISVMDGGYKNPRNFASGSLNQLDPEVTKERGLDFIAYEVVQKDFDTEINKLKFLDKCGFKIIKDTIKLTKPNLDYKDVVIALKKYMDRIDRANLPYDIDGVVVKVNDIKIAKKMGTTSNGRKPKSSRAVKFPPERKETKVIDVISSVGRTGAVIPIAILEPFDLGGSTITRATLHNYGSLVGDNALKIGATVIVSKAGDIIPKIDEIKKNGDKPVPIPKNCPSCGTILNWDKNKVHLICDNINCPAQLTSKIDHWLKKIGVKGIGKGILDKLTDRSELEWEDKPILSSLPELYYMLDNDRRSEHPFRKYAYLKNNFGEKAYSNIIDSVKSVKEVPLNIFIEALGIGRIGSMAKDIVAIAPTVDDIDQLTVNDLLKIDGFANTKAEAFINGWKELRKEIHTLLKYISIVQKKNTSDKLNGKSFCFTGSFESPTRKEMEAMVVDNGGKLSSVSKNLTALVFDGETMKGKYEKAEKIGVDIITQQDFLKLLD